MNFLLSYIVLAEIFCIIALSTNLMMGIVGIFSVAQAAIMGIGAYTFAILLMNDVGFLWAILAAAFVSGLINLISALPSLRLAGDYFVITSFGMQLVATAVFMNWNAVTGGAAGLFGIPIAEIAGYSFITSAQFLILSTIAIVLVSIGYWLLMRAPYGKLLHAVRLDELAVVASGRHVLRLKLSVSAVSGIFAGISGALYAAYISFIDPSSFDMHVSILVITMVVVGGARTLAGSIIGPFLLLAIPQVLALIDIPSALAGPGRQMVYGLILIAFMMWRPQGIAGKSL
ncbi:MAG: branched-chain amino acid ABC transporter permease [Thalassovita sp.]